MKKILLILIAVCIPHLAMSEEPVTVWGGAKAFNILEQGKIIREQHTERFDDNEDNFVRWYVVIYQSVPYKCSVMELNYKIRATCFNMPSLD
jgi:hypothetical protein|tara:strand:+ start:156 stop:431 length:276 start_codon:yes stop_codon:yes gene_type:complete